MSPYRVDARFSGRHPFELFALVLTIFTTLPTVLGVTEEPLSINEALPSWLVITWSVTLLAGSLLSLAGIYWKWRPTGLAMEQVGLVTAGSASVIYAACILLVGVGGPISAGYVGAFGIACFWRWWDLQKVIAEAIAYDRLRNRGND